jgi:hypothetical protein
VPSSAIDPDGTVPGDVAQPLAELTKRDVNDAVNRAVRSLDLSHLRVGVVVIGHAAPWEKRRKLIAHFRETLPGVPIVALLRRRDKDLDCSEFNCSTGNPPLWLRTVNQTLAGVS